MQQEVQQFPTWFRPELYPCKHRWVKVFDHHIHYFDQGFGPTLLLLHGALSWSQMYIPLVPLLSGRFRLIAPDMPGFGLSIPRDRQYFHTMANYSVLVTEFIEQLGLKDVIVLGINLSGPVGVGAASLHPEDFAGLILSGTMLWPLAENSLAVQLSTQLQLMSLPLVCTNREMVKRFLCRHLHEARLTPAELEQIVGPFHDRAKRRAICDLIQSTRDSSYFLGEVKRGLTRLRDKPVLYFASSSDPLHKQWTVDKLGSYFPQLEVEVDREAPVSLVLHSPETVAGFIRGWHRRNFTQE